MKQNQKLLTEGRRTRAKEYMTSLSTFLIILAVLHFGLVGLVQTQEGFPKDRFTEHFERYENVPLDQSSYDFVVIGGGSAGSVVASRLSEEPSISVLLLEAGPSDNLEQVFIPSFFGATLAKPELTFNYFGNQNEHTTGASEWEVRAKMIGGGSSVNGMVYARGQAKDYDQWSLKHQVHGWSWDQVLPYFKKSENNPTPGVNSSAHGTEGPLHIQDIPYKYTISNLWEKTLDHFQVPYDHDYNDGTAFGYRQAQTTVNNGHRVSVAEAFLKPSSVLKRQNLRVRTLALADRIIFDANDKQTANTDTNFSNRVKAVEFTYDGKKMTVYAKKEVILSAGTFGSVEILQRSGIGNASWLKSKDIPVVADLPGVGQNLQNHLIIGTTHELKSNADNKIEAFSDIIKSYDQIIQNWANNRTGPLISNLMEVEAFIRTPFAEDERSDIQIQYAPLSYVLHGTVDYDVPTVTWAPTLLYPKSRGFVRIKSKDANELAEIENGYLSDPRDLDVLVWALNHTRNMIKQSPFLKSHLGPELMPESGWITKEQLQKYIRQYRMSDYHVCCTAKMGNKESDPMSVLDNRLRVYGVNGLRVCDLSSIPSIVGGNTNGVAIMVGERCADAIKQEHIQGYKPLVDFPLEVKE